MSAGPVVRRAHPEDLEQIIDIERDAFSSPWQEDTFRSLLQREDVDVLVVATEEAVIGYAVLWATLDEAELANLAVRASHRGQGVGSELLEQVLLGAQRRGVRRVFLEVRASNEKAIHLYARRGFKEIGVRRRYYHSPVEDARVLVLDIGPLEEAPDVADAGMAPH